MSAEEREPDTSPSFSPTAPFTACFLKPIHFAFGEERKGLGEGRMAAVIALTCPETLVFLVADYWSGICPIDLIRIYHYTKCHTQKVVWV